jgi:hypothetical protein
VRPVLPLMFLAGCIGPGSAQDLYLALHGRWTVDPDTLCESVACGFDEVDEVREVIPEVAGVVEVIEVGPTTFTLEAIAAGDTLVTVSGLDRGSDLVERYAHAIVRPVSAFPMGLRCDTMEPSDDPWILPPGAEVFAQWNMWDTDYNTLLAEPAFEAEGVVLSELDAEHRDVIFTMPEQAAEIDLTSALYDGVITSFSVHEDGGYDGFEANFWPETPIEIGLAKRVQTAMLVDGLRACADPVERVASISTPGTCSFASGASLSEIDEQGASLYVFGLAEGTCTVEVAVPVHGSSVELSMDVIPAQEPEDSGI